MHKILIILLVIIAGCKEYEEPLCFQLKYKMTIDESRKILSKDPGEFNLYNESEDYIDYKKDKCVLKYDKKSGFLVKAYYQVFSEISEAGTTAIPK